MTNLNEIAATLESLPDVLSTLFDPICDNALRSRPMPDEWCPLEVVGHLIACDSGAFRDRIEAIVHGDGRIPPFDPWAAIRERDFAAQPAERLIEELRRERAKSAALVRSLTPADLSKSGTMAADDRRFAAGDFVHEWPFHDQDHLQQILAALKLHYLPAMTPTMRNALTSD